MSGLAAALCCAASALAAPDARCGERAAPNRPPSPRARQVPVALAYKRDAVRLDGTDALVLSVYGARAPPAEPPLPTLPDPDLCRAAAAAHDAHAHRRACSPGAYGTYVRPPMWAHATYASTHARAYAAQARTGRRTTRSGTRRRCRYWSAASSMRLRACAAAASAASSGTRAGG